MSRPRFPRSAPVAVALSAPAAGVIAPAGSAQGPPNTLNLVAKSQRGIGFSPHHRPHQGDRFGFGDKITGDDTGVDRGVCTLFARKALCNIQAHLSKGNLSL